MQNSKTEWGKKKRFCLPSSSLESAWHHNCLLNVPVLPFFDATILTILSHSHKFIPSDVPIHFSVSLSVRHHSFCWQRHPGKATNQQKFFSRNQTHDLDSVEFTMIPVENQHCKISFMCFFPFFMVCRFLCHMMRENIH